jgi:hypothetical protein
MRIPAWVRSLAIRILNAADCTLPIRHWNRWTRLALAPMVALALMPAHLVDSGRAADTDHTFTTGKSVSAQDASWAQGVAMANHSFSTARSESPAVSVREPGAFREAAT